jgi:hypothetical protein
MAALYLPTFIIAGAMRSGTTSLNAYLREHPEVAVSTPKEVHFFDQNFDKGLDWYGEHFSHVAGERAIGEATPDYVYHPEAMGRIAATLPEVRILITLRNPIDRAYSHYWHNRSRDVEQLSFADAIAAEPERIAGDPETRRRFSYVDRGRYTEQIERLFAHIAPDRVQVATFDDLNQHPSDIFAKTCGFLGIDAAFTPPNLGEPVNAYAAFRSPKIRELSKPLPRRLRNLIGRLNQEPKTTYPEMSQAIREHLAAEFEKANAGLSVLTGVTIPEWS